MQIGQASSKTRSTIGYCTLVEDNLVIWKSKKQTTVSKSSTGAEYRAMGHGICDVLWLRSLLKDLEIKVKTPMQLYGDNQAALYQKTQHFMKEPNTSK